MPNQNVWQDAWWVSYSVTYMCGSPRFPLQGTIIISLDIPETVIQQRLQILCHTYCPGCLVDRRYTETARCAKNLGCKSLCGDEEHLKCAEIVHYQVYCSLFSSDEKQQDIIALFKFVRNRQSRIWINYREACWHDRYREELLEVLHDQETKEKKVLSIDIIDSFLPVKERRNATSGFWKE